jgi:DNA-binding phage protein
MAREGFEFNGGDFADESIVSVKGGAKRQFIEAGLNEEQAEYNAQFLASGLSTFAHRAGMTSGELYRALGLKIARGNITGEAKMYA